MALKAFNKNAFHDLGSLFSNHDSHYIKGEFEKNKWIIIKLECNAGPDDPFRWLTLQEIVNNQDDVILFQRIKSTDPLPKHQVWKEGKKYDSLAAKMAEQGKLTISALKDGGGLTIISKNLAKRFPNYSGPVNVDPPGLSRVFHIPDEVKKDNPVSLAHELFGHYFLHMIGAPGGHNDIIKFRHCVPSPFEGIPFVGNTDTFITKIVNWEGKLISPTLKISKDHIEKAFKDFAGNFPKKSEKYEECWKTMAWYYDFVSTQDIRPLQDIYPIMYLLGLPFGREIAKEGGEKVEDIANKYSKEISNVFLNLSPGEILLQLLKNFYNTLSEQNKGIFRNHIKKPIIPTMDIYRNLTLGNDLLKKIDESKQ